jgi:hypothetical protein
VKVKHVLLLLYITSWKTLNLPYQSLQVLRDVEQKCLSSFLGDEAYSLKTYLLKPSARKDLSFEKRVFRKDMRCVCLWYPNSKMATVT